MKVFVDLFTTYRIFKSSSFFLLGGLFIFYLIGILTDINSNKHNPLEYALDCTLPEVLNTVVENTNCGESIGAISIELVGGNSGYEFDWFPNIGTIGSDEGSRTDLSFGVYTITISDLAQDDCVIEIIVVVQNENGPQVEDVIITPANCMEANASVDLLPDNFIYTWLFDQTQTNSRSDLAAGTYAIFVFDIQNPGCANAIAIEVEEDCSSDCENPVVNNMVTIDATCGNNDGQAMIVVNGSPTDFNFTWSPNVSNNDMATTLGAGTYEVTIADVEDNTCFTTTTFVIGNTDGPVIETLNTTPASCEDANGTAAITPASFEYEWSDGGEGSIRTGLAAGIYQVTYTDPVTGCFNIIEVAIENSNPLTAEVIITDLPTCGEADGIVSVNIAGGGGSYTVDWSDGGSGTNRSDLPAGTYSITVTEAGGSACTIIQVFTLQNEVIGGAAINITNQPVMVSCSGEADGVVNFTINFFSGFVLPETISIVDAFGNPSNNGFLAVGNYCLIVTDGNGCLAGQNCFEVTEPSLIDVGVTLNNADCNTMGMISLEVTGGNGAYMFDWEDLGGTNNVADRNNLFPGFYNLTVTDIKACTAIVNNLYVADECDPCLDLIIDEAVNLTVFECYELGFYCLPIEPPNLSSYQITDNGAPYFQGVAPCDFDSIPIPHGTQIALDTGYHQIIVHNIFTGCQDTLIIEVACTNIPCPEIYNGPGNLMAADCDSLTALCLDIPLAHLFDYSVFDNGSLYQGGYSGCDLDSAITYLTVGFNTPDQYALDSWTINGQVFTIDSFTNIQELVDSMNVWDPNAGWSIQGLLIVGGDFSNVYGNLIISKNGAVIATVNPSLQLLPNGVAISIDTGYHEIIVSDTTTGCEELIEVFVSCIPIPGMSTDTIELTLLAGFSETICLDTSTFSGAINFFNSFCFPDNLDFFLDEDQYCVDFTGINIGTDTLCIEICDDIGFCHQSYIIVNVVPQTTDTIIADILAGMVDTICLDTTELAGTIVSIANFCISESGTFIDFDILDEYCVSFEGLLPGATENACLVICDEFGFCDTTIFIITSIEDSGIVPPIAIDDDTTTLANRPVNIDILGNDTLNSTLIDIGILTEPENGAIVINTDLTIIYIPEASLCNYVDSFTYFITTLGGSDTATVIITVSCDEVVIYNGISPNGDGLNDGFIIGKIDDFSQNEVRIFNRWGNQVFQQKGYSNDDPFDGTWNGKTLPDGVYFYLIEITGEDGKTSKFNGYLQIHR